ncbi:pentapeptide repeat-containing protein [Nocardiopsis dassonvillei]|uniref:pentapeptide repeat-containing protein n=1 Tax=Nocardiopsis dassonvillei TaxID=2014 RepID=UPI0036723CB5
MHALARLADEAPEGREDLVHMVIDVLCAYLRMPYTPRPDALSEQPDQPVLPLASPTAVDLSRLRSTEPDDTRCEKQQAAQEEHRRRVLEFESFQQVRHTIIRIIGNRLREPTRWRGKNYDFTGVVFDGGDLSGARFSDGPVNFRRARFSGGEVDFSEADFTGEWVDFNGARFSGGRVNFLGARFSGGTVDFGGARFSGGEVDFNGASGERPRGLPADAGCGDSEVVHLPEPWLSDTGHDRGQDDRSTPDEDTPDPEES